MRRCRHRHQQRRDEFTGLAVLHAIVDEEILERHSPVRGHTRQFHIGRQRDQHRRQVADRRAVRDIATHGSARADLKRAEAAHHLGEVGAALGQRLQRRLMRHRRSNAPMRALPDHITETLDPACPDHVRHMAVLLGHPQPHIGRPGNDGCIPGGGIFTGEFLSRGRRDEPARAVTDRHCIVMRDLVHEGGLAFAAAAFKRRWYVAGFQIGRRVDNRPVAGAAAQIACKGGVDPGLVQPLAVAPGSKHRHHKTRGAEAALRAVPVHHHLLAGMQLRRIIAFRHDAFDGGNRGPLEHAHELDAGIYRMPAHGPGGGIAPRDDHGAGPAIPLGAAFLGPGQAAALAQPVEQRGVTGQPADPFDPVVQDKCDCLAHGT